MQTIPVEKCRHGYLYAVKARNFTVGLFDETNSSFIGVRHKFNDTFFDMEYHADQGPPYGSCFPLKELRPMPLLFTLRKSYWYQFALDVLQLEEKKVDIDKLL